MSNFPTSGVNGLHMTGTIPVEVGGGGGRGCNSTMIFCVFVGVFFFKPALMIFFPKLYEPLAPI